MPSPNRFSQEGVSLPHGYYGYVGRILRVDLTEKSITVEPLRTDLANNYIGGRGLGARILWEEVEPGLNPLSPRNKLMFLTGPLTGTRASSATKFAVVTKSFLTGIYAVSLCSGTFGPDLKYAGFDGIIIEGKAEKPVYLWINDMDFEIKDARHLWSLSTDLTQKHMKRELKDETFSIACIGPAGEKLVRFACIVHERRTAGRCGTGTIMGSKNLKAIAIRGTGDVEVRDIEKLKNVNERIYKDAKEAMKEYSKYGTPALVELINYAGALPTRNFQSGVFEGAEKLTGPFMRKKIVKKDISCWSCPVGCSKIVSIKEGSINTITDAPEYETISMLGSNCGIDSIEAVTLANKYCDDLGLDTLSTGNVVAFAMECYERGLITKESTEGLEIKFGDHQIVIDLIKKIANREGFGDLLAEGVKRASEKIGKESEKFAIHVKGLEIPGYSPRSLYGAALNYATSPCGGHVNRGSTVLTEITMPSDIRFDPVGKGRLVKNEQDRRAVYDSAVLCLITRRITHLPQVSEMLEAVTGMRARPEELMDIGERINNLERAFNVREGITRKDDILPWRCLEEPMPDGPAKGRALGEAGLNKMLDEYYGARGWNEKGIPQKEKLQALGLTDVAKQLELLLTA
jgi:aldehyde:ferredoxin oxidoreductase